MHSFQLLFFALTVWTVHAGSKLPSVDLPGSDFGWFSARVTTQSVTVFQFPYTISSDGGVTSNGTNAVVTIPCSRTVYFPPGTMDMLCFGMNPGDQVTSTTWSTNGSMTSAKVVGYIPSDPKIAQSTGLLTYYNGNLVFASVGGTLLNVNIVGSNATNSSVSPTGVFLGPADPTNSFVVVYTNQTIMAVPLAQPAKQCSGAHYPDADLAQLAWMKIEEQLLLVAYSSQAPGFVVFNADPTGDGCLSLLSEATIGSIRIVGTFATTSGAIHWPSNHTNGRIIQYSSNSLTELPGYDAPTLGQGGAVYLGDPSYNDTTGFYASFDAMSLALTIYSAKQNGVPLTGTVLPSIAQNVSLLSVPSLG